MLPYQINYNLADLIISASLDYIYVCTQVQDCFSISKKINVNDLRHLARSCYEKFIRLFIFFRLRFPQIYTVYNTVVNMVYCKCAICNHLCM